jgi:hypothetical protein
VGSVEERDEMKKQNCIRRIVISCLASLTLTASLMAQQEISPDRFESTSQSVQRTAQKNVNSASNKKAKKQTARVQNASRAPRQTASLKNAELQQLARK